VAYRINYEKEKCIGCGACVALCPDNWAVGGARQSQKGWCWARLAATRGRRKTAPCSAFMWWSRSNRRSVGIQVVSDGFF
jgi:ferredoxin